MDWSLYRCGGAGHITYAPDEADIREHMRAAAAAGELWRCLRCGTFVTGAAQSHGPASEAPAIRRGKEIRSEIILRIFAVERVIRFVLFGVIAYAVWRFAHSRTTIAEAFNTELPLVRTLFRQLGYNINHSSLLGLFRHALNVKPKTLTLIAVGLAAFAVVELIEGVGLWLAKRWGEYFAAAVTSLGLPYEIYDIWVKFTWTRLALFALNLALVLYLVLTRRLFGARGGKHAYEARLRSESVLDEAAKAAAASQPAAVSYSGPAAPGSPSAVTVTGSSPRSAASSSGVTATGSSPPPGAAGAGVADATISAGPGAGISSDLAAQGPTIPVRPPDGRAPA